ncbi:MAG TPA: RluA family pseudouridine synthase [Polyangiaceae bacterium]|jgi:23S rRNA pseudouridine1911/1915/1917 synthase|nr:RluA family pseudouridine synthase [Polyangiaceae bacterium]
MTRISARELSSTSGPFGRGVEVVRPASVPEGSVVSVLRVPPEAAGMRLDRFVQSQLKRTSRTRAQKIILRGAYSPDAKPLRGSDRVRAEQCILLWRAPWDEQALEATLPILFEDDHLLAINKPAGIPVHPTARHHKGTVVKMLEAARDGERLMLAHRIDRETSGVLLLSRTPEADRHVKAQFARGAEENPKGGPQARSVRKRYIAITWGWPEIDTFRVDLPLELDPTSRYGVKMRVARPDEGLRAVTICETGGRRIHPETGRRYALVRCSLETGRQHQIRLHLAALGLPLVGDKLYGPDDEFFGRGADGTLTEEDRIALELDRHALHAELLELDHPVDGRRVSITAPLTPDLAAFWEGLCEPEEDPAPLSPASDPARDLC